MNPDPEINQTLNALRDTQPPEGMQSRLLTTLTSAQTESLASSHVTGAPFMTRLLRHGWGTLPIAAALTVAILVVLAHTAFNHAHPEHPQVSRSSDGIPATALPSRPTQTLSSRPKAALFAAAAQRPAVLPAHPHPHPRPSALGPRPSPLCDCDPTALAETEAPSHPAPPLPLTDQEILMLRLLHSGDPVEIAELDPRHRAETLARDRAETHAFFHPSTTGDHQ